MATVNDPKNTTVIPFGTQPTAKALREAEAKAIKPSKRDDFSWSLDNMLRWWVQDLDQDREEKDEERTADIRHFQDQIDITFELLSAADLLAKGELSEADILRINPHDEAAMNMRMAEVVDYEKGRRFYLVGKSLEQYETRRTAEAFLSQQGLAGGKTPGVPVAAADAAGAPARTQRAPVPEFRVTTPGAVQGELIASINKASQITGVPTALLGAMTGIESGFGKNLLSPTGAIGSMQQTGGYRDTMWKVYGEKIATHVPAARAAMADGLTKDEKRNLAFNNDAAILMVALRAKDFCKQYKLDINDPKSWGMVYLDHNSGEGSVKKLLAGEMTDKFIRDVNPAVYRGVDTPQAALANFQSKIISYAKAYEKVEDRYEATLMAAAKPAADAAILKASGKPAPVVVSGAKPEPVPT